MRRTSNAALLTLAAALVADPALAYDIGDSLQLGAELQVRMTLCEQMEEVAAATQFPSGDKAVQLASGFSIPRMRLKAALFLKDRLIEIKVEMRLEGSPGLLDAFLAVHVHPAFSLYLGQIKIPSVYENLTSTTDLDFIFRSKISELLADYSLSRGVFTLSHFYGVRTNQRDLGIAVKGDVDLGPGKLRYFLMMGNGMGANLFIGGGTGKEFIVSNAGEFFLGARVEAADFFRVLTIGGHASWNRHANMAFNSGTSVYDLDRTSWSADLRLAIPKTGLGLTGMYAGGIVAEDYDGDGRKDMFFFGWEARLVFRLTDPIRIFGPGFPPGHDIEVGGRFDTYSYETNVGKPDHGSDAAILRNTLTFGVTYLFGEIVKVQLNYIVIRTHHPVLEDLDDDALLLQVQGSI